MHGGSGVGDGKAQDGYVIALTNIILKVYDDDFILYVPVAEIIRNCVELMKKFSFMNN